MSMAEIIDELPKLQPEERRELSHRLSEFNDYSDDDEWDDDEELTAEEKTFIEMRLAECDKPNAFVPWEEVDARLKARYGS